MSPLEDALRRAIDDLQQLGVDFALVGGLAVSIRAEPRFTRDVDCAVSVTDDRDAERVVSELLGRGYRASAQVEQETARRLATMRLTGPTDRSAVVDLLFASSGIEREIVRDAETIDVLPGIRCKVARCGHLLALKVLARDDDSRPQDKADLVALLKVASAEDLEQAREAARLIAQRGFARGKADLSAELERTLTQLRGG
jgi:hypothetical protein